MKEYALGGEMFKPTGEQIAALDKFQTGRNLKITAFAGAGKTATLTLLAKSRRQQGLYLAFNRSIADEAKEKFPDSTDCRTTHSIAWRSVQSRHRFSSGKMKDKIGAKQLAAAFELNDLTLSNRLRLTGEQQAYLMLSTVRRFSQSADETISKTHVPAYGRLLGMPKSIVEEVQQFALKEGVRLWKAGVPPV